LNQKITFFLNSRAIFSFSARDGLEPKNLHGNRFYKGHREIAEKASQHFEKASIPLKMYLKSFTVLEKVSISLKKSKNNLNLYKSPTFLNRMLHYSGNVFKKTHFVYKILILIRNRSLNFLKMS
jgi:predicted nucleic-acid-binding protein